MGKRGRAMTIQKRLIIMGFDPGESFGYAVLDSWCPIEDRPAKLYVNQGSANDALGLLHRYHKICASHDHLELRCATERYTQLGGPHRTAQAATPELVGRVKQACSTLDIPLEMQAPGDVKTFANNNVLKKYGLYTFPFELMPPQSDADDANDAMRHAFYLFGMTKPSLYDRIHRRHNS